ncbi:MAG: MFS transporter [Nocardioidaceae bacterium]
MGSDGARREPLFTPAFIALGLADLGYFTALGVAIYVLPLYVTGPVGSDRAGAGLAFGAFAVAALVGRPVAGRLADSRGRRPLLLGGAALLGLGMVAMPVTGSLWAVVVVRLVQGLAEAAFFVAGLAMLIDIAPASRVGEATSYSSLGLYLGLAFGPPAGEWLVGTAGFPAAWYGAGALCVVAALFALLLPESRREDAGGPAGERARLLHRPALPFAAGFGCSLVAAGGFLAFASLHARDIAMTPTSLALFVYGGVVVASRVAFARVPDRLPTVPLAAASLVVIGVGLVVMASWATAAGLLVGVVLTAVGVSFSTPAFFTAIFATAGPGQRGAAAGTAGVVLDLGLGVGPILLGLVAREQGITGAFAVGGGVALAGAAGTALLALRAGRVARPAD